MNQDELIEIFLEASKLMIKEEDRCGNLIYPKDQNGEIKVREPQLKHAITTVLTDRGINFGIEMRTAETYRISGEKPDRGNTDLVIYSGNEIVNVELKADQPAMGEIAKDFKKMLGENVAGVAFFNVLKSKNKETLPGLLKKYQMAYEQEKKSSSTKPGKWFLLFIFVREKRKYSFGQFTDIGGLSGEEFVGMADTLKDLP